MAFEIRFIDQGPVYGGSDPVACRFTDDEWWNLLSLAHECGFDPSEEYAPLVYPESVGETNALDSKLSSGLYIGVSAVLNQDTLPFATTWESDDGRLHFRWANAPDYVRDQKPGQTENSGPDFALDKKELRRLMECLRKDQVLVARIDNA
ncbi:MAG: hypothetical protein WA982_11460 [Rubrobacteraceae bacterium]